MLYSYYTPLPQVLSENELNELFFRYQNGDREAFEKLLLHNLLLVKYVIKKYYYNYNIDKEDLFQIGIIGLQKAIETYDTLKKVKITTYAMSCIRNEISRFVQKEKRFDLPSLDDMAFERKNGEKISYLSSVKDDSVDIERVLCDEETSKLISELISKIPKDEEREILKLWLSGKSSVEIAPIFGISKRMIDYFIDKNIKIILKKLQVLGVVEESLEGRQRGSLVGHTLYDYLGCTREVFYNIYATLKEKDKENLKLLLDGDLDKPIGKLNKNDRQRLYSLLNKFKTRLKRVLKKGGNQVENTNREGSSRSLLEAEEIEVKKVPVQGEASLTFDKNQEVASENHEVEETKEVSEDQETLPKTPIPKKRKNRKLTPLMELLGSEYSKEEKEAVLKELSDQEKELILLANGEDLDNPVRDSRWDSNCNYLYYQRLIPKLKRHLERRKKAKEEVTLETKDQNDALPLNYEMANATMLTITKQILKVLELPDYQVFLENFRIKDIVISALAMQLVGDISLKEIADFLKVSEREVIETTKRFIMAYRKALSDYFDKMIESLEAEAEFKKEI